MATLHDTFLRTTQPLSPKPSSFRKQSSRGFTIVELLIVIVVIAVLAAITIVAYNGVQQRANNAAIIDAASKSMRMIQAYIAANGTYPANAQSCITNTSGCTVNTFAIGTAAAFDTSIATMGTLPRSIPMSGATNQSGLLYTYTATRTYNGDVQPVILYYWLYGTSQQCGLSDVVTGWTVGVSSVTGYTAANDSSTGKTLCYIHVAGPSV